MPRILALIAFLIFAGPVTQAQPTGYVEVVPIHSSVVDWLSCFVESGVYTSEMLQTVAEKSERCRETADSLGVNFATQTLIVYGVQGDCQMRVATKLFRVDAEKKYRLLINKIYGGCKAMLSRKGFMVVDRLNDGYGLEMKDVPVETDDGEFQFPTPPPTKTSVQINVSEVDLSDCLPLTGQSQWVINDQARLIEAFGRENRAGCKRRFAKDLIDFERYTLLGLSFASGHCERPGDLRFEAIKQTSSEPRDNAYVFTAAYEPPTSDTVCEVWTTHTIWLLMPKIEQGYGITLGQGFR